MTIEEKIQALLESALTAYGSPAQELVTKENIKTPGDWQDISRPYVIHFPVTVAPTYTQRGLTNLKEWVYQVSVFADAYKDGRTISDAVRDSLTGNHDGVQMFWDGLLHQFESDPPIHHFALTFQVFEAL